MPIQTVKASEKNTGGIGFQPVRAKEKQHDRQDAYPTARKTGKMPIPLKNRCHT
jgi:hypothetical protein